MMAVLVNAWPGDSVVVDDGNLKRAGQFLGSLGHCGRWHGWLSLPWGSRDGTGGRRDQASGRGL